MVHNGARHILLLDFFMGSPNSLDWPIKSSGPNNVCNAWYILKKEITLSLAPSLCLLLLWLERAHTTHLDWILGVGKGRAHWTRIHIPSRTELRLGGSGTRKWLSITLIKVSVSFIPVYACFNVYMRSYVV